MRVSVKELLRNFSMFSDKALSEPVIITKNGRDRLVLIGVEEFAMLKDMIDAPSAGLDQLSGQDACPENERPKRA